MGFLDRLLALGGGRPRLQANGSTVVDAVDTLNLADGLSVHRDTADTATVTAFNASLAVAARRVWRQNEAGNEPVGSYLAFCVDDFGASTAASAAVNDAAFAAAFAASDHIRLGPGTYDLSVPLAIPDGLHLEGPGSAACMLRFSGGVTTPAVTVPNYAKLVGFTIDGSGGATSHGLVVGSRTDGGVSVRPYFHDVFVQHFASGGGWVIRNTIEAKYAQCVGNFNRDGLIVGDVIDSIGCPTTQALDACEFGMNTRYGVDIQQVFSLSATGKTVIFGNANVGINIKPTGTQTVSAVNLGDSWLEGNSPGDLTRYSLDVDGSLGTYGVEHVHTDQGFYVNTGYSSCKGVRLKKVNYIDISGKSSYAGKGLYLEGGTSGIVRMSWQGTIERTALTDPTTVLLESQGLFKGAYAQSTAITYSHAGDAWTDVPAGTLSTQIASPDWTIANSGTATLTYVGISGVDGPRLFDFSAECSGIRTDTIAAWWAGNLQLLRNGYVIASSSGSVSLGLADPGNDHITHLVGSIHGKVLASPGDVFTLQLKYTTSSTTLGATLEATMRFTGAP